MCVFVRLGELKSYRLNEMVRAGWVNCTDAIREEPQQEVCDKDAQCRFGQDADKPRPIMYARLMLRFVVVTFYCHMPNQIRIKCAVCVCCFTSSE